VKYIYYAAVDEKVLEVAHETGESQPQTRPENFLELFRHTKAVGRHT